MSVRVPAGEMRHSVYIIEHKVETGSTSYDTYGMISASSSAWTRLAHVRAKITELTGNKDEITRQKYPTASHVVTVDYLKFLNTTGATRRAVEFNGRRMFISNIMNPDQENRQMEIICAEAR